MIRTPSPFMAWRSQARKNQTLGGERRDLMCQRASTQCLQIVPFFALVIMFSFGWLFWQPLCTGLVSSHEPLRPSSRGTFFFRTWLETGLSRFANPMVEAAKAPISARNLRNQLLKETFTRLSYTNCVSCFAHEIGASLLPLAFQLVPVRI